jgi:hypothetical protein
MAENLQQREVIRKKLELSLCSAPFYGQCALLPLAFPDAQLLLSTQRHHWLLYQ